MLKRKMIKLEENMLLAIFHFAVLFWSSLCTKFFPIAHQFGMVKMFQQNPQSKCTFPLALTKNLLCYQTEETRLHQRDNRRGRNTIADGHLKEADDRWKPTEQDKSPFTRKWPQRAARSLLLLGRIIRSSQSDTGTPSSGKGIYWKTSVQPIA